MKPNVNPGTRSASASRLPQTQDLAQPYGTSTQPRPSRSTARKAPRSSRSASRGAMTAGDFDDVLHAKSRQQSQSILKKQSNKIIMIHFYFFNFPSL